MTSSRRWAFPKAAGESRNGPGGLTAVELAVVVSIIGVLAAILVPAVQSARESARTHSCRGNLRQIGIGMAQYNTVHGMFPPAQLLTTGRISTNSMSPLSFILPYIEQTPVYTMINMSLANVDSAFTPLVENRTARNTVIGLYLCPSDSQRPELLNSYRFNYGRWLPPGNSPRWNGPFNVTVRPSDKTVTDGLSMTAFVSERVGGSFSQDVIDNQRAIKNPVRNGQLMSSDDQFIPYCLSAPVDDWNVTAGRYWMYGGFTNMYYNHNGGPNDSRPSCNATLAADNAGGLHPPRSFHPSCVNVLFGDGHVSSIPNSVSTAVWRALGTHAAGDIP